MAKKLTKQQTYIKVIAALEEKLKHPDLMASKIVPHLKNQELLDGKVPKLQEALVDIAEEYKDDESIGKERYKIYELQALIHFYQDELTEAAELLGSAEDIYGEEYEYAQKLRLLIIHAMDEDAARMRQDVRDTTQRLIDEHPYLGQDSADVKTPNLEYEESKYSSGNAYKQIAYGVLLGLFVYWLIVAVFRLEFLWAFCIIWLPIWFIGDAMRRRLHNKFMFMAEKLPGEELFGPFNLGTTEGRIEFEETSTYIQRSGDSLDNWVAVDPYFNFGPKSGTKFTSTILIKELEEEIFTTGNGTDKLSLFIANWTHLILAPAAFILSIYFAIVAW